MLKDTIISAFNYDGTLLKWLKKVEEALKNASASEFRVNKKGNATISFSIVFANGETLESDDIVLQQGESVTGATIRQGHLILTLSNGNELDAGDVGAVTGFSINDSQHLIVTYQNGTTQDLGAIFTGNVNIEGNLEVNGNVTVNDIPSTEEINGTVWGTVTSILSVTQSFVKAVYNFRELQFIFNCRLANESAEEVTITSDQAIAQFPITSTFIRSKIIAHNGSNCNREGGQGSIAMAKLFISTTSGVPIASLQRYVNLYHSGNASLLFYLEGGNITVPANTSYDFEARITLAL